MKGPFGPFFHAMIGVLQMPPFGVLLPPWHEDNKNGHDFFTRQLSGYAFTSDSMRRINASGKNHRASANGSGW
ncbi:protein of unknown function [Enterobacter cancerogenus]|nr:protein of unknown function [Enterobacter cancerogenus]